MNNNKERAVLCAIGQITDKINYDNPDHLRYALQVVSKSDDFKNSTYGKRYIEKIGKRLQLLNAANTVPVEELIRQSDAKTKDLFRDMDDILFQVASQHTTRTTQRLVWVIVALTIINTMILFYIALLVWRLNMG